MDYNMHNEDTIDVDMSADKSMCESVGEDGNNLLDQLKQMNKKFRLSCNQVVLLNNEIEYLQIRYDQSVADHRRSFRYFLRLKIATLEGVRNMLYEYACRRADQLDQMHEQLLRDGEIEHELDLSDLEDNDI